jgi:ArsR family transcriptional regulator
LSCFSLVALSAAIANGPMTRPATSSISNSLRSSDVDIGPVFIHNHFLILTFGNTLKQMKTDSVAAIDGEQLLARAADIEIASRSLKAMSHPLRLKILCTLGSREVCVQGIVENVGTSQSNISQHLAILRDKGILSSRKDANKVFYRVGDERTLRLIGMMQEVFCTTD